MIIWPKIPYLRLLIPFILGIITGISTHLDSFVSAVLCISLLLVIVATFANNRNVSKYKSNLFLASLVGFGFVMVNISKEYWLPTYFTKTLQTQSLIFVKITEPVSEKTKSYKTFGEVIAVKNNNKIKKVCGKVVLYFEKNQNSKNISYGNCLIIKNNIQELKAAPNPNEFSPKDYLGYRGIYHSCYLHEKEWTKIGDDYGNVIKKKCYEARDFCLRTFEKNGLKGDEFAVASAMIVGFEDELRPEIISYFSSSGAMHLLSVSGLHIAFVYLILSFLLRPFRKFKNGKYIELALSIFVLWFYAIVTGFSAPVLRSAIMFSFVVYAKTFEKSLNMYNILALAGFYILCYEPLSVADVGFQLSFLALLSILLIQPIISELYYSKVWLVQKAWEITSVSISATIGTLPFTFYYFHQFPNYFLLVNLLVIPLSTLLLYCGFAVILLAWIPIIPILLTTLLHYITKSLNFILSVDENTPGSVTRNIQIGEIETIIFFISIIFLIIYLYNKQYKFLLSFLAVFAIFIGTSVAYFLPHIKQRKIIVYSVNSHTAIDFFIGNTCYFVADSNLVNSIIDLRYHIYPNRIKNYINEEKSMVLNQNYLSTNFQKKNEYISFENRKIVILNDSNIIKKHIKKLAVDYALLSGNINQKLDNFFNSYEFNYLILDTSIPKKSRKKIIKYLKNKHVKYWDVQSQGAFEIVW